MRAHVASAPKRFRTICFLILGLTSMIGCAAETAPTPKIILPATGSPMTPEWNEYNTKAEAKGAPLLKYVVTAKSIKLGRPREPKKIQDNFALKDGRLYVYTKWLKVQGKPIFKIRIYDPRGILFREHRSRYRHSTGKWNLWSVLYIKGWAAARLPGKWRAEIYMDGILAKTKEFVIGSVGHQYELKGRIPELTIGVYPFFDAESSYATHANRMPLYIAQMLTIDLENFRVVMPFQLREDIVKPVVKYEQFGDFLKQEVHSPDSELNALIRKHKLDLAITGRVLDSMLYDVEKEATLYLFNTRTKHIKEIKISFTSDPAHERTPLQVIASFYKDVYDTLLKEGANELKIAK